MPSILISTYVRSDNLSTRYGHLYKAKDETLSKDTCVAVLRVSNTKSFMICSTPCRRIVVHLPNAYPRLLNDSPH